MKSALAAAIVVCAASSFAIADVVVLNNGDTLNGEIGQITSNTLEFKSPAFGKVNIPLKNVSKYTIDKPVRVQPKREKAYTESVSGEAKAATIGERTVPMADIKYINPPAQEWTGAAIGNFALARGNTNKFTVGAELKASLRREDEWYNDRYTLGAAYNFGRTGGGRGDDEEITDTNNWHAEAKWDKFWTDKLYGYVNGRLEHDDIANLYYRVTPGVGVGYQWLEGPKTTFSTEGGVTYVHETFLDPDTGDTGDTNDNVSLRAAYKLEHNLTDAAALFHNLEYLQAVDNINDYNLIADIGLKLKITPTFLAQFKLEYRRDNMPADDAVKDDVLWLIGLGWQF